MLEETADRIEAGTWTGCPCGVDHGQADTDQHVPPLMRADADAAGQIADAAARRG